jgi:creatinine amidohydrolase
MTLPRRHWFEMSWTDIQAADTSRWIAVLPVAAIEQHGPHLPVGVDTFIAEGCLAAVHAILPDDLPVTFLPVQAIGKSNEHLTYPGTLTLDAGTAIRAWTEIGESLSRAGVKKLVLVNSHGGNVSVLDIVARDLRVRCRMLAVTAAWHRLGLPPGLYSDAEMRHGIHGGDMETSLMLAFRPDLVRMDRATRFASLNERLEQEGTYLRTNQPVGFGWMSQDLNPAGVVGDATLATAEKGAATADLIAQGFVRLLREVDGFDLTRLAAGPLDT